MSERENERVGGGREEGEKRADRELQEEKIRRDGHSSVTFPRPGSDARRRQPQTLS